MYIETLTSAVA